MKTIITLSLAFFSVQAFAVTERPTYEVLKKDGAFEIREYDPQVVAVTAYDPQRGESQGSTFMRLFRFISGSNSKGMKIAMTAPVMRWWQDGKMFMTFTMPKSVARAGTPQPLDKRVEVKELPKRVVAAVTYSWYATSSRNAKKVAELRNWLQSNTEYKIDSPSIYAGYNRPGVMPNRQTHEQMFVIK